MKKQKEPHKEILLCLAEMNQRLKFIESQFKKSKFNSSLHQSRRKSGKNISKIKIFGLEKEAGELLAQGKTYQQIADAICQISGQKISKSSVDRYFKSEKGDVNGCR